MEPKDCEKTKTCLYKMWYSINKEQDLITINVEAKQDVRTWTGIGFAMYHDVAMVGTSGTGRFVGAGAFTHVELNNWVNL